MMKQVDFFGQSFDSEAVQLDMFDRATRLTFRKVDDFFCSLKPSEVERHKDYWNDKQPKNLIEQFQRFLFAFMSVHTSWQSNVVGYNAIKDWTQWFNNKDRLFQIIKDSRVGMYNRRTEFIHEFSKTFWKDPNIYVSKSNNISWQAHRNHLASQIKGLKKAKTSFALEMLEPNKAEVFCADVHLYRMFGLNQSKDARLYETIENHWLERSKIFNVPSYVARAIYWNRNQNQEICDYWAHVFN